MHDRESEAATADREMTVRGVTPGVLRRLRLGCLAVPAVAAVALIGCGGSSAAEVGDCTTGDPAGSVQLDVMLVDCGDAEAKSKITKKAKTCPEAEVEFEGENYCLEPN